MRLHNPLLKPQPKASRGFTLVELLVAASAGSIGLYSQRSDVSNMRSGAALEATQRLRTDWSRVGHFIESKWP